MTTRGYELLSAQDGSFLEFGGAAGRVHITAVGLFEGGALAAEGRGIDVERIRAHVASRLHHLPRYRQRIDTTPLGQPMWVDDDRFDLAYHVRHAALPSPGTESQLKEFAARVSSESLDGERPLWELWIVEGLSGGRFAIVAKVHHCMVDGVSGVAVLNVLLSATRDDAILPALPWKPRPRPGLLDLLADGVTGIAERARSALDATGGAVASPRATGAAAVETAVSAWDTLAAGLAPPPATPLNEPVGAQRRVDWCSLELSEIRDLRKRLDGSVNDIVLTIASGAVRRLLQRRRTRLRGLGFRVIVPVDMRTGGAVDLSVGNRVSAWFVTLPVGEKDFLKRFRNIRAQTLKLKRGNTARGVDLVLRFADWTAIPALTYLGVQLVSKLRPYNLIVTNVHGPQVPLYLLGARLTAFYPGLPLFDDQGLAIAVLSYEGRVHFGLTGDRELVPDLAEFSADLEASFEELRQGAESRR